ncbi:MAG: type I pullulanase [Candidatus Cloacimonetes bacterium 4572_55]|nr:MAG: type I pullulanase [Candidatus Cloacimonetes bacterium 4572_55]
MKKMIFLTIFLFCMPIFDVGAQEEKRVRVHYHRYDGNYEGWNLWTWDKVSNDYSRAIQPLKKRDHYGLTFVLDKTHYGSGEMIGLLPRKGEWLEKDDPDRIWTPNLGNEAWILQNDPDLFVEPPDTYPQISGAFIDAPRRVTVCLPISIRFDPEQAEHVRIIDDQGQPIPIQSVAPGEIGNAALLLINTSDSFRAFDLAMPIHKYRVEVLGFKPKGLSFRMLMDRPEYVSDVELGAIYKPDQTLFRLFAPTATRVTLTIYDQPDRDIGQAYPLESQASGVWEIDIKQNLKNKYYTYKVDGNSPLFHPDQELIDPYSRCNTAHNGRGMIIDDGTRIADRPDFPPEDAIIYELHVRDFSIDTDSGINQKGLYLGMTEQGATYKDQGEVKTGLDHLVEMGVNTVQIMPIQDFDNNESSEEYNWGYMPVHFNSPDGWYATEQRNAKRVEEFKKLVDALHTRGIRVIMDVVYNHTAETNPYVQYSFNGIAPGYYYRMRDSGSFWNGSGCGNEFRSEAPMVRKFILDSVAYWVNEYKVDGFRFDLMGLIDLETMTQITETLHEIDPNILVYGEPWASGETPISITSKGKQRGLGFGVFNDNFRDALKGSPFDRFDISETFLIHGSRISEIKKGIEGSIHSFAQRPLESVNYMECHDNRTLWDQLHYLTQGQTDIDARDIVQMVKLGAVIIFTSQGVPFIQMGQEMLRTKHDVENSYNAPDSVNQIEWERKIRYRDVVEYHKGLIQLRKAHQMFRQTDPQAIEKNLKFLDNDLGMTVPDKCIAYQLEDERDEWERVLVLLNPNPISVIFPIPPGTWTSVVDENQSGVEPIQIGIEREKRVAPRSAAVLAIF